jgi:hypothetical protein
VVVKVAMPTGKTITLDGVTASDTIDNVKAKIQDGEDPLPQGFQLVEKLEGSRMLSEGLMCDGKATFQVVKAGFGIWVKPRRCGTFYDVEVEADETIADLKAKIKQLLVRMGHLPDGAPALLLRVGRVSGENFCNELPLSDYWIQAGDCLQVSWSDGELQISMSEAAAMIGGNIDEN